MGIEEWWGRTFEGRGTVRGDQMPGSDVSTLRKLNTEDVAELFRSQGLHDNPSVLGVLSGMELRRRENWTTRAGFAVSVAALAISIVAVVVAAKVG